MHEMFYKSMHIANTVINIAINVILRQKNQKFSKSRALNE